MSCLLADAALMDVVVSVDSVTDALDAAELLDIQMEEASWLRNLVQHP